MAKPFPMENPLNDQQIQKINEIAKLPPEKQQAELSSFLKTLNPEQIEFLKSQQGNGGKGGSCPFCNIAQGKIASKVIYEDNDLMAVLDINPAGKGHSIIFPKEHFETVPQMPDKISGRMFILANKISKKAFDMVKAEGTNVIVSNGAAAGQTLGHAMIHVIPRFKDDGLSFSWQGKRAEDKDLDKILKDLKGITLEDEAAKPKPPEEVEWDDFDESLP